MTNSALTGLPFYLGLPQWHHARWSRWGLRDLADYSRFFNTVEGNTTFYALPNLTTVMRWRDMTPADFRFCFKFPAAISHQAALQQCDDLLLGFFRTLAPLEKQMGQLWLQLPAKFSPEQLSRLWAFCDALPRQFTYGVEVRHPVFFAKGEAEKALNRGLKQRNINRVILDSRPLHHASAETTTTQDAQQKKPRLPVHVLATGQQPLIRFIGSDCFTDNQPWFAPWQAKIALWRQEKHSPFLFIHTPDNGQAPWQALRFWQQLQQQIPDLPMPPDRLPEQTVLF